MSFQRGMAAAAAHATTPLRLSLLGSFRSVASIAHGPRKPELLRHTIPEHFDGIVSQHGDRTAVSAPSQRIRLTYAQLDVDSGRLASGLSRQGVRKGDRVAVSLGNTTEFATIIYALFKLGAILVPLNPGFNSVQIISALNHLTASHLIIGAKTCLPHRPPRDNTALLEQVVGSPLSAVVRSPNVPSLSRVIVVRNSTDEVIQGEALRYEDVFGDGSTYTPTRLDAGDIINIQFTSGTTSTPKAVCLTHRNILNNGNSIGDRMGLTEKDVICCPPPLFHCFGSVLGYMASATHGAAIVFPSEAFDPLAVLQAVESERATALYGVPTMFQAELDLLQAGKFVPAAWQGGERGPAFPTLRTGIASGTAIPIELMKRLREKLNLTDLTICYGMTETSPVSLQTTIDDSLERRTSTVGKPLPHVGVKVVDPSARNRVLPIGERGELAVNGYGLMSGYWEDPKRTEEAIEVDKDGETWLFSGDEASMDADGYVKITGRLKDLIIRGGENIYPLEVENCLLAHPGVSDVSVVGVLDTRHGEAVGAFVVLSSGAEASIEDLRAFVRERLSHHLVPKHVWFVSMLPKTESGKVKKYELRDRAKANVPKVDP